MLKILGLLGLGGVGLYLGMLAYLYLAQRRMQYFPTHNDAEAKGGDGFEPWTGEGKELQGYWRPTANPKRVVLFFHGNGGEALDRSWMSDVIPRDQLLILAEYPGYGARPGSPTEQAIFKAAEKLVDEVLTRWRVPITLVGESLGSAVAVYIASRKPIDKVALISPFSSAIEIAASHYPYVPVKWLMKDRFQSLDYARSAKAPLQVVHGTLDEVVPMESSKKLFEAYGGNPKSFHEVPGFGHSNIPDAVVDSPFVDRFRDFLK